MKKYAPLATLVAVVLLGAALLVANMLSTPDGPQNAAAPAAAAAAAPDSPAAAPVPAEPAPEAGPAPPVVAQKAYTGRSAGDEVRIAIAVKDGKAVAYACDGDAVEAWMEGTLTGGTLDLQGRAGTLTATVDEKATLGTIVVDGKEWPFAAEGVQGPAGLYEGRGILSGVTTRIGWIVEDDGTVTGVASGDGRRRAAPPLDPPAPGTLTVDGSVVTVTAVAGDTTVVPR